MNDSIHQEVIVAVKWSAITEIAAKLITPLISMLLARLLVPEVYGVVATLMIVITFAELFTDAGFQKFLVQHRFKDDEECISCTNVAFWSNLFLSIIIWGIIILFRHPIAEYVGSPGLGDVFAIACVCIPLEAFSSIQMAIYRRDLDFKPLFKVRMAGIIIPLLVTVPLAYIYRSYWALIIGTIASNVTNAFLLTFYSRWKPALYFSFKRLRNMLSFTMWSLFEAISIWLTQYVDVFIVATALSTYYLGLYKTSSSLVGQIMGLVTTVTTPILFSSLSRLQNSQTEFEYLFFKFQKVVGLIILPMGVIIYVYRDFITNLILGSKWIEASGFIGLWALTSAFVTVWSYYCSEIYRAKGKPKLSVLAQVLHIAVLWPVISYVVNDGFETLYIVRSLIRFQLVLVNLIIMYIWIKLPIWKMFTNVFVAIASSMVMAAASYLLLLVSSNQVWIGISIFLSVLVYLTMISFFKEERLALSYLYHSVKKGKV